MNEHNFDQTVGRIAGAIYGDISREFPHPPLMLVPALTFKVRKVLERISDLNAFSQNQISDLAKTIRISIIPMLFLYEIREDVIEKIAPLIESAAAKALAGVYGDENIPAI